MPVRKNLHDLLSEHPGPEGVVVPLAFFHDIKDEDTSDRVVLGTEKPEVQTTYSGAAVIEDEDVPGFKKYMNEIWNGQEREVRVVPPKEEGGPIRVARAERDVTEIVN